METLTTTAAPLISAADHGNMDQLERAMLARARSGELVPVEMPLVHRFTPGMYSREIFMPAGTLLTSKIHKTEHQYVVLSGRVKVLIPGVGVQELTAGDTGITKAGTRRVLYTEEDTRWISFHPTTETDLEAIEEQLIERRELADGSTNFDHYQELLDVQKALEAPQAEQLDYGGAP